MRTVERAIREKITEVRLAMVRRKLPPNQAVKMLAALNQILLAVTRDAASAGGQP